MHIPVFIFEEKVFVKIHKNENKILDICTN